MKKDRFWLNIIGVAILLHITLIVLSIIEVAIYSYLIVTGKDESFYQSHAEITGPWISGIFGSLFIFLLVRRFIKKNNDRFLRYAIALPLIYIFIDILILIPFQIDWNEHFPILLLANGAKILAALLSYYIYNKEKSDLKMV